MSSSQPEYPYAVIYNKPGVEETQQENCVSLLHAQAVAMQGMSLGWENIYVVDLNAK